MRYLGAMCVGASLMGLSETRSLNIMPIKDGCQTIVWENPFIRGGLTIPASIDGSLSLVIISTISNSSLLAHEVVGHGAQICEQGAVRFIVGYLRDPYSYETDADKRAGVRISGR